MAVDEQVLEERFDAWTIRHPTELRPLLRLPIILWRLGLGPLIGRIDVRGGHLVMLTVTGRSTRLPRHTPLVAHDFDGRTYLWCPYGDRAQWYHNAGANPVVTVQSGGDLRSMRAVAITDVDEVVRLVAQLRHFDQTFLRSYLEAEGVADTDADVATNAGRLHLRRLDPTEEEGPPALPADLAWVWPVAAAAGLSLAARRVSRRCRRRGTA
jgi:deazaflavin-dependent oxidoreductase (nitroreductase family)